VESIEVVEMVFPQPGRRRRRAESLVGDRVPEIQEAKLPLGGAGIGPLDGRHQRRDSLADRRRRAEPAREPPEAAHQAIRDLPRSKVPEGVEEESGSVERTQARIVPGMGAVQ
jgi:hypothetical protein